MNLFERFSSLGLRTKFIFVISLLIIGSATLLSYNLISTQVEIAERGLLKKGAALVEILAINCEYGIMIENEMILNEAISATAQAEDILYIIVENKEGRILASASRSDGHLPDAALLNQAHDSVGVRKVSSDLFESDFYDLSYPVVTTRAVISREMLGSVGPSQGHVITEVVGEIHVGLSLESTWAESIRTIRTTLVIILVVISATILLSFAFVNIIIRPIERLANVTEKISQGDLSLKTGIEQTDEIGRLAQSFDDMVDSLKSSRLEIEDYNRTLEEKIIERTRELENAQSQLVQSEKMAAVGQLSAGVAHELNNPLGGILGYAQYTLEKMNKKAFAELSEKEFSTYKRHLQDIEAQARRCKTIVQNLLKFSRISSKVDMIETAVNDVLVETISLIEHQLIMNKIHLATDLQTDLPLIMGNAGMLQQVFTNIIINALHACEEGGNIIVTSRFSPAVGEFSGVVEVSISDDGIGIPEKIQKNIFEPFFTTKAVGKGTGLGLSVSYGIVKEHGGEIKIESIEGCGTTFTIILPLEKRPSPPDSDNMESAPDKGEANRIDRINE
jgi:signal transduction histidine kinase